VLSKKTINFLSTKHWQEGNYRQQSFFTLDLDRYLGHRNSHVKALKSQGSQNAPVVIISGVYLENYDALTAIPLS
jgi:hypothetical protein